MEIIQLKHLVSAVVIAGVMALPATVTAQFAPPPALPQSGGYGAPPPQGGFAPSNQPTRIATNSGPGIVSDSAALPSDPAALPIGDEAADASEQESEASIQIGNFISIIREGGVLMLPIVASSIVLLVFVFERSMYLRRSRVIPKPFVRGVIEQLEQQQLEKDDAVALCDENGSPIAELFSGALKKWGRPAVEVEQAVLDSGERVTAGLRKYLRLFNAISNLAPLLGLLGTVLGMIDAFNTIASADAMGRPELLASGIGAALLSTAAGLCVAIPAYAAYAFFVGRADQLTIEMDGYAQTLVDTISAEALAETGGRGRSRSRRNAA